MTKIIDARGRPLALDPFYGSTPERANRIAWVNRRVGCTDPEHFVGANTLEDFLADARASGIDASLVIGRQVPIANIANDRVAEVVSQDDSLIGVGAVDPSNPETGGVVGAVEEVRRSVETLGLQGINMDPGFGVDPMLPNDRRLYPVYAACEGLGVPVFLMSGPLSGPTLEFTLPRHYAAVASDFPDLDVVVSHGAYPFVEEAVGAAFRNERLYLSPDIYTFMPGGGTYIEGMSGVLAEQFIFATGYPFRAMKQTVDEYRGLDLGEAAASSVLHGNIERILGLVT